MRARTRRPETTKLDLSDGDWLLVRKYLTAGEKRRMFAHMLRENTDRLDPLKVGVSRIAAYLLDWSFLDVEGQPMAIRDQPREMVESYLDAIDDESFEEVLGAVDGHITAMTEQREKEKASPFGAPASSPTPPSAAS